MTASSGVGLPFAIEPVRRRADRLQRLVALVTVLVPSMGMFAAVALLVAVGPPPRAVLVVAAFFYVATVLGVTVGYHRHFTHGAFESPGPVRAVLAALGSMAAQGPLIFWVAEHRAHHQFSDRGGDPHSPAQGGLWHAHVGWMLNGAPPDLGRYAIDLLRDRLAIAMNQSYFVWVALGLALPGLIAGLLEHSWTAAVLGALWGGLVRIFLVHHATWAVNSICHRFGARPHQTRDGSTNHWLVALFSLGEGWHNNHHAFPTSARHGLRTWELDPSWWAIRLLSRVGLATALREPKILEAPHER